MVIAGGLQEVFRVFETLLLPVDTVASLLANHKNKDQIKNNIQDCIKEGENAKYGVLNAIGYKELFPFCRVVVDRFIDQEFSMLEKPLDKTMIVSLLTKYREKTIDCISDLFKQEEFTLDTLLKHDSFWSKSLHDSLLFLGKKTFDLYKRQRTWLENRFLVNNHIKKNGLLFKIKKRHLDKSVFFDEISKQVINTIKHLRKGIYTAGISEEHLVALFKEKDLKQKKVQAKLRKKINKRKAKQSLKFKSSDLEDTQIFKCVPCAKQVKGKVNYMRHIKAKKHKRKVLKLKEEVK